MKSSALALAFYIGVIPAALAAAFKPYPGAKLDEQATNQTRQIAAKAGGEAQLGKWQIWITSAPFDQVLAFYRKNGAKEFMLKTPYRTGEHEETLPPLVVQGAPPGGLKVQFAIFILDDAASIQRSKQWLEITRPSILLRDLSKLPQWKLDTRDLTGIAYVEKQ
jgi:hypothetical protein